MDEMISKFLGSEVITEGYVDPIRYGHWHLVGKGLSYEFNIDRKAKTIGVSADPERPFAAQSLFEICIAFDYVKIEKEEQFYGDREILVFRKDYPKVENFKVLMVMKWDDGNLSIWPQDYETSELLLEHWDE